MLVLQPTHDPQNLRCKRRASARPARRILSPVRFPPQTQPSFRTERADFFFPIRFLRMGRPAQREISLRCLHSESSIRRKRSPTRLAPHLTPTNPADSAASFPTPPPAAISPLPRDCPQSKPRAQPTHETPPAAYSADNPATSCRSRPPPSSHFWGRACRIHLVGAGLAPSAATTS